MSSKRLNILCEGSTEESFVKNVLTDYLKPQGIIVKVRKVHTNIKKDIAGGVTTYSKVKDDLIRWVKENSNDTYCTDYYTSMFDYYKLPPDFPCSSSVGKNTDIDSVQFKETCLEEDLCISNFIPYIQLHEFEALVFAGLDYLICDYPNKKKEIGCLKKQLDEYNGAPEKVNSRPHKAPSKRLEDVLGKYNKVKSGITVTSKVGIDNLMKSCPHFGAWIEKLKSI